MACECAALRSEMLSQRKIMIKWFESLMTELQDVKLQMITKFNALNIDDGQATTRQLVTNDPTFSKTHSPSTFLETSHITSGIDHASSTSNPPIVKAADVNNKTMLPTMSVEPSVIPEMQLVSEPKIEPSTEIFPSKTGFVVKELTGETSSPQIACSFGSDIVPGVCISAGSVSLNEPVQQNGDNYGASKKKTRKALMLEAIKKSEVIPPKKQEKHYKCKECDYETRNRSNMRFHVMTHSGDKPFRCAICTFRGRSRADLVRHNRSHTGEKPYACNYCDYRCNQKYHLIQHHRKHTGEKFKCNLCDYQNTYKNSVYTHMQREHKDVYTLPGNSE